MTYGDGDSYKAAHVISQLSAILVNFRVKTGFKKMITRREGSLEERTVSRPGGIPVVSEVLG